jgi:alanyl-tRNA synthetase
MDEMKKGNGGAATRRLYFEDAYLTEFEARVVDHLTRDGRTGVVLDATAFYPEAGGQPPDRGTLNGVAVVDVQEDGGRIIHFLDGPLAGEAARGRIDWPRRFDHMQQHTGQHILSQAFLETRHGETRSFHLGPDVSTLEIGLRSVEEADLEAVERAANTIVFEDREVKTYFVPQERIHEVPLRRPPKVSGLIRVVEVAGFDYSACGGTHVRRTGEIGLIKVVGWEKIRDNVRFTFVCGGRALADYAAKTRGLRRIAGVFSAQEKDAAGTVEKMVAELKEARQRIRRMAESLAAAEAKELVARATGPVITLHLTDRTPEEARFLALQVSRAGNFAALCGVAAGERGHLILAAAEGLGLDLRKLVPVISAAVPAKGGGGPTLVEMVTAEPGRLAEALAAARAFVESELAKK